MPRSSFQHRLFIALWPSATVAERLTEVTAVLHTAGGGRKIPQQNQHITVVFLGDVQGVRGTEVQRVMHSVAGASFELTLDAIEYRKRGGMMWARATRAPDALSALVDALRAALTARGFVMEDRAFVPHVTLLRDARKPAHAVPFQAAWRVDELTLVRSHLDRSGARYEIIARVPLSGP